MKRLYPVIIVGGGQAGLSAAYFLRRHKIEFLILDGNDAPGGSWSRTWQSLKLFSPASYSSLSGWALPETEAEYPTKNEFIDYLAKYEKRYGFNVQRSTQVNAINQNADQQYVLETNKGTYYAQALVIATGTASGAFTPSYPGADKFKGEQLHSIDYRGYETYVGKKVLVVGAGNTGAQLFSELAEHTEATWASNKMPTYLPDHLDGRYLFESATQGYLAAKNGSKTSETPAADKAQTPKSVFGNIVMVEPVKRARDKGLLEARIADFSITETGVRWGDNTEQTFDTIIWATGFKPNLDILKPLGVIENGGVKTDETRALDQPGLWIIGMGEWTGYASATIYGVGKTARNAAKQITEYLEAKNSDDLSQTFITAAEPTTA